MQHRTRVLWMVAHFLGKEFSYWSAQPPILENNKVAERVRTAWLDALGEEWRKACDIAECQEQWDVRGGADESGSALPFSDEWDNTRI